jgi:primosomal protein N' (replication factor Y)
MDRDTVCKEKNSESGMYQIFKDGGADILVGTKLVAKGFHFPRVTLVGVVDADTMLQMPDFRAAERTVQMLVQAAGRAGRWEKPGEVYLQTSQSEHYAIQAVARCDYTHFARQELVFRQELDYPPSSTLIRLVFLGSKEELVKKTAQATLEHLRGRLSGSAQVLGPAPGIHSKLRGRFRYHVLLKLKQAGCEAALQAIRDLQLPSSVRMQVDVDPYDFF